MHRNPVIVKVSGSLFDLQGLGSKLEGWLAKFAVREIVLVPGGGPFADVVRQLDRQHALGEEMSHWLAVASMSLSAQFLCSVVPRSVLLTELKGCAEAWENGLVPVLDPYHLVRRDEGKPGCLPHSWKATSDSIAARIAVVAHARELILLKSVNLPDGLDWTEAGVAGYVDPHFAELIDGSFHVRFINFRQ
jgi:aspartokinase-like uncharacterized kinase